MRSGDQENDRSNLSRPLGVKNAANILIAYRPARADIANPGAVRSNRRKFVFVDVCFDTMYFGINLFV